MSLILSVSFSCNWELWGCMIFHIWGTNWVSSIEILLTFLLNASFPPPWWLRQVNVCFFIRERELENRQMMVFLQILCLSLLICRFLPACSIFTLVCSVYTQAFSSVTLVSGRETKKVKTQWRRGWPQFSSRPWSSSAAWDYSFFS